MELPRENQKFTIRDYLTWPDGERWELIDGIAYAMSPAPRLIHQRIVARLSLAWGNFLEGKTCEVFVSPVDVYFHESEDGETVVQPDLGVICDRKKIREHGIVGAPDLVIEILSPSTAGRDMIEKAALYEREGVPEYWIVSPEEKAFFQKALADGRYETQKAADTTLVSKVFPEFTLDVKGFFASLEEPKE